MARYGFYMDIDTCIGCRTCQVACSDKNRLSAGILFRHVDTYETGEYPAAKMYHYSSACNHCEKPKCLEVCPAKAIYKGDDGSVQYNKSLCIGCESCVKLCPYSVPKLLPGTNLMGKCDSCKDLRIEGRNPVCVDSCLMRCLHWGDLNMFDRIYGPGLTAEIPILPLSDTNPSVKIKPKPCVMEPNFRKTKV